MRRREFIALVCGALAAVADRVHAQQAMPVIGFMSGRSPEDSEHLVAAFREGLRESGFVEGQNLAIEFRWARGQYDRLPALASELLNRKVTLLAAVGGDPSAQAAKKATTTVPIVFGVGGDPVTTGLVESFGRPGANLTGSTLWSRSDSDFCMSFFQMSRSSARSSIPAIRRRRVKSTSWNRPLGHLANDSTCRELATMPN